LRGRMKRGDAESAEISRRKTRLVGGQLRREWDWNTCTVEVDVFVSSSTLRRKPRTRRGGVRWWDCM